MHCIDQYNQSKLIDAFETLAKCLSSACFSTIQHAQRQANLEQPTHLVTRARISLQGERPDEVLLPVVKLHALDIPARVVLEQRATPRDGINVSGRLVGKLGTEWCDRLDSSLLIITEAVVQTLITGRRQADQAEVFIIRVDGLVVRASESR